MSASELHAFEGAPALATLAWRLATPHLAASTASVGGGIGLREWVLNVQVARDYRAGTSRPTSPKWRTRSACVAPVWGC